MSNLHIPLSIPSKHSYFIPGLNTRNPISPPANSTSNSANIKPNSQANNANQSNSNISNMSKLTPQKSDTVPLSFNSTFLPGQSGLGQFSPNIFTTRRVWIKKVQGTPTTISLHQNDIIDDLKQAVLNKFPNSLAREFDPADLLIKIDLQARQSANAAAGTQVSVPNKKSTYSHFSVSLVSPDNSKNAKSPVSQGSQTQQQPNAYSYINLEPDQNVWNILDIYYPKGMSMQEAFIVETPYAEHSYNRSSFNGGYNNNIRLTYAQAPPLLLVRPINPAQVLNASQKYYQPKPQYMHQSNPIAQNLNTIHDKSISPSTAANGRQSPLPYGANVHRRSQSNPLQSPSSASAQMTLANNSENSQAVLLLPKNFSLATGPNISNQYPLQNKKRLSLDENLVQKNKSEQLLESPDGSNANLTNIGMGIHSQSRSVPEAFNNNDSDNRNAMSLNNNANNNNIIHKEGNLETHDADEVGITPSPPIDESKTGDLTLDQILNDKNDSESPVKSKISESSESFNHSSYIEGSKSHKSLSAKSVKISKVTNDTVLPSISVLVVEDNAINQAILGAFLRKYKIPYQIAKNGQEAIDKWRTGGFHLVLMDIQLPVKSGIEATKEIRRLEKINRIGVFAQHELSNTALNNPSELKEDEKLDLTVFRSPVIIVALTASSNSSVDRKNALRAGCNDYLTKPVNLVWLQNKITEWGCMQTLINFDGWKAKRSLNSPLNANSNSRILK